MSVRKTIQFLLNTLISNCKLKFESQSDLDNHQRKFCIDSDYGNVTKLERKLHNLGQKDPNVALGMNEIKQYLRGEDPTIPNKSLMGDYNLNELRDYFQKGKLQQDDTQRRSQVKRDLDQIDQMKDIKKEKHLMRMRKDQDESDLIDLLRDLEQRKEKELRAQIEKEEIQRNLKDLDKKQLTALERERKKELERLAVERENLRLKEQKMMDEVKKMEQQLVEQEKFFRKQKENADRDPNKEFATNNIRSKELELAKERGQQIVSIKAQRDRLEKERERIMDDLDKVKNGNLQGIRRNDAARLVASQMSSKGFEEGRYPTIEPSLKDKLINDQVKVNYLREQQRKTLNEMLPEIDDIDILGKQLENRNFISEAAQLANEYDGRQTPNRPLYLGTIRQTLENQAAGPSSYQPMNNAYQANLPPHIPQGEGQNKLINNLQSLKDDYLVKGGGDPDFINKINDLENFLAHKQPLPKRQDRPPAQHEVQVTQTQPPFPPGMPFGLPPPPFAGFPPPVPGMMPPYYDPMLQQMNNMLQQQEIENQRLREALEGIDKTTAQPHDFDHIINNTAQELDQLKSKILPGGLAGLGNDYEEEPFPEDFVFRQNEFRCEDLEVEERALMNITAQEYDALRVMSKLHVNSELYRYKMDQYKELSTMRAEIEKVLQEQRLEKIRRDFEKQKYEDERRFKHEKWLEDQKRQILEAKLKNAARGQGDIGGDYYDEPQMLPPNTSQDMVGSRRPSQMFPSQPMTQQSNNQTAQTNTQRQNQPSQAYDPSQGFILFIDFLFNLMREYKQIRLVYSIFQDKKSMIEPRQIEMKHAEADFENQNFNKVVFNSSQLLKHVKQHPSANLIIELQVPDPKKGDKFSSLGWTLINVFDPSYNLNKGKWRLPIYRPPTVLDLDIRDINKLTPSTPLVACIRICSPKDDIFNFQPNARTNQGSYVLPLPHDIRRDNSQQPRKPALKSSKSNNNMPQQQQQQHNNFDPNVKPPYDGLDQRDPNYEVSGLQVFLHYVRNLNAYFKCKIQATLYEGPNIIKQDNYSDCNWATTGVDKKDNLIAPRGSRVEIGLDGQIQIIKPPTEQKERPFGNNLIGQPGQDELILPINQDVMWQKDLYNMLWDHNIKDNMYLLLQVFIVSTAQPGNYNQGPLSTTNYEPYGYTVFIVNNDDGKIRFGTYEQPLYRMPINLYNQVESSLLPASIKFSLVQPRAQPLSVKNQLPNRNVDSRGRPQSEQFIPNFEKQYSASEDFQLGDGVDIYVDWARHLPDNTMFSKVLVRCVDSTLNQSQPGQRGFASIEYSTGRNPFYGFKYELRGQKLNPTLLVFVSFETIDRSNGEPRYAGHSFFPLFMDRESKLPITDPQSRNYTLHKGLYQMPVYCQNPNSSTPFTYENFIYLERVPTASMLIRIYKAPRAPNGTVLGLDSVPPGRQVEEGVLIQAPVYKEGTYNTQYYMNTALENKLFFLRKSRKDPPLSLVLDAMLQMFGQAKPNMTDDQKLDIIDKIINVNPAAPVVDMNYFSQYAADIGFRVGVEAVINNTEKAFFGVIMSICPRATFYDPGRVGPATDAVTYTAVDWESSTYRQKFSEGLFNIQNIRGEDGMILIFDIKKFIVGKQKFEDFGFALFPLFDVLETDDDKNTQELYVNSGMFTLPVFRGSLDTSILQYLLQTHNPFQTISQMQKAGSLKAMSPQSIIVKVVDNQRERHFEQSYDRVMPSSRFIPPELVNQIQYKPGPEPKQSVKLKQLVPERETITSFQQFLSDYLHSQYKL